MTDALIIDDNHETADAFQQMLEMLGIPAQVAYAASPAISILSEMTPRVVLLDIKMPGLSGIEILAFMRREPRLAPVPVIVVTSDDQPETRKRVTKLGANDIIIKPASVELLEASLRKAGILG